VRGQGPGRSNARLTFTSAARRSGGAEVGSAYHFSCCSSCQRPCGVVGTVIAGEQHVLVNPTDAGGVRPELRLDARGQLPLRIVQVLQHPLGAVCRSVPSGKMM